MMLSDELIREWDYVANGDIDPREVRAYSHKMLNWICERGHEWQASPNNRSKGTGCPFCAGTIVTPGETDLATVNPKLAAEWHPQKNGSLTPRDVKCGSGKRVWWQCERGHEWQASVDNRSRGRGCPYCAGRKVMIGDNDLATKAPDLAAEWHPEKNGALKASDITISSSKKIWWKCKNGHEWQTSPNNRSKGVGCPYCAGRRPVKGVNDLATTHPDLANEWDPDRNGDHIPEEFMAGSRHKAWWICKHGHSYSSTIDNRSKGKGCPYCSGHKAVVGMADAATIYPNLQDEWSQKNMDTLSDYLPNSLKKAWWKCKQGHEWFATISSRTHGSGCPYCAGKKLLPR